VPGDDVTKPDLALMLSKHGMSAVQYIGLPEPGAVVRNAQAAVVALKSRTAPVEQAVTESLAACDWLTRQGARQIFFKYCSTFDSTEKGNIGPVAEALLERLNAGITLYCPAFPENGRTVYSGHLFVGGDLLSDSSMRQHPLTPMSDSNLVRFLGKQVRDPETVGLIMRQWIGASSHPRPPPGACSPEMPARRRGCPNGPTPLHDRGSLCRFETADGRLRCRHGTAGELPAGRSAAGLGRTGNAAQTGGRHRGSGRQLLGGHAAPGRADVGALSVILHRPLQVGLHEKYLEDIVLGEAAGR
jgi:hypothetical protein